jgi:hypothetical protein
MICMLYTTLAFYAVRIGGFLCVPDVQGTYDGEHKTVRLAGGLFSTIPGPTEGVEVAGITRRVFRRLMKQ